MKYKFEIDSKCDNCGLCVDNRYVKDSNGDMPQIIESIISEEHKSEVQALVEACPVNALSFKKVQSRSKESFRNEASKLINNFKLQIPDRSFFAYDSSRYESFDLPTRFDEEFNETYGSRDAAKDAGCRLIVSTVLPLRVNSIRNILRKYGEVKLAPYTEFKESKGNFYFEACKQAENILKQIQELAVEVSENYMVSESLNKVRVYPEDNSELSYNCDLFAEPFIRANAIGSYLKKNDVSRFRTSVDVDTKTVESWSGRLKTKYYFCGLYEAVNKVWDDITSTTRNQFQVQVIDWFYPYLEQTRDTYNKLLTELLNERLKQIDKNIG